MFFFFFNDTATTEIYTLSLHDALPIFYDVGRAINPTLVEGQIEGGAMMGLGLGLLEEAYPYYPAPDHRGGEFGAYLAPALEDLPELDNVILESPSAGRPFRAQAIGEMANKPHPPALA